MPTEPDPADAPDPPPAEPAKPPVRRGRLAAVGAALLAAAVWFAPALVARSGLRHTALERLFPALNADATVGRAELAWLEPAVLRDVTVTPAGAADPVLVAAEVRTSSPLHALLRAALLPGEEPPDYGTVTLVRPRLRGSLRPGGSDLEDLLAPLFGGDADGPPAGYAVAIEDGAVTLADPAGAVLHGADLSGAVRVPAGAGMPDRAKLTGRWGDGERSGPLAVRFDAADGGRWTVRTEAAPLTAAAPLLTRFAPGDAAWALDGTLEARLAGTLNADGWTAGGTVRGERLTARRGDWPAADRLRLATASLSGELSGAGSGGVTADGLAFTSDLLDLTADGPLPTAVPADPAGLLDADRSLAGRVDAAALAAQLPGLLGLADGVTVEAGTLTFSAAADAGSAPDSRRLTAAADLAGLRAVLPDGGERVAPRGPIAARLIATRDAAGTVTVERLAAEADGLSVVGGGTAEELTAEAAADLAAFDATFGRLLALGGRLGGTADGTVSVRRAAPDRFAARFAGTGRDLRFAPPTGPAAVEEEVRVKLGADLARNPAGNWSASLAGVRAEAGGDVLTILPADGRGLSLTLSGELESLSSRMRTLAGLPIDSAAGDVRASAIVAPEGDGWRVRGGRAEFRRLAVNAPGLRLREAAATLTADGVLNPAAGTAAGRFAWVGDAASVRAERFAFDPAATPAATADLTAEGDLARVWRWFPAADGAGVRPAGRFAASGAATAGAATGSAGGGGFSGQVRFTDPAVLTAPDPRSAPGTPWAVAWGDRAATLAGSVRYEAAGEPGGAGTLHLGPLALQTGGVAATAGGTISDPGGSATADLSGRLTTDWAALAPRLGLTDAGVTLTGTAERPFAVRGPLAAGVAAPGLAARAGLGWDRLAAGGFDFGPGGATATLSRGRVRVEGVDWPLFASDPAAGRLRTTPLIDLTGAEPVLRLPAGRVLTGVRLSPELTRGWLGLVSPLAARSVAAEGSFGVDLDGAAIPLADALAGDARRAGAGGRLEIASADLTPGPVAGDLLRAVRGANRLFRGSAGGDLEDVRVELPGQSVPFRLRGGRVFHENLTARGGSVEVATTGSVGLDGTLDLRAEVPLGGDLGDRRVSVPVGGTLDAPRIDAARLAGAAAEGALDGALDRERGRLKDRAARELGRGLERLFGRE